MNGPDESKEQAKAEGHLYTEEETAALLKMTVRMLARRRRSGAIGSIKHGRWIRFTQKHIDDFQTAHNIDGTRKVDTGKQEIMVMSLSNAKALLKQLERPKPVRMTRGVAKHIPLVPPHKGLPEIESDE